MRDCMAVVFRQTPDMPRPVEEEDAAAEGPVYATTHGRYPALVGRTIGTETETEADHDSVSYVWMADAMAAPAPGA
ncbi:hypothetical protein DSY14_19600 [Nocardiopsis sp. MG754419]|nr:hypothetical protein [Nocardiopsis sp. MG754419]